jgi:hypothetical protein
MDVIPGVAQRLLVETGETAIPEFDEVYKSYGMIQNSYLRP